MKIIIHITLIQVKNTQIFTLTNMSEIVNLVEAKRRYREITSGWDKCTTFEEYSVAVAEYKELHQLLYPSSCQYVPGWLTPEQREIKRQKELEQELVAQQLKDEFKNHVKFCLIQSLNEIQNQDLDKVPGLFMEKLFHVLSKGNGWVNDFTIRRNIFVGQSDLKVISRERFEDHVNLSLNETLRWFIYPRKMNDFVNFFSEKLSFKLKYHY
ncbi:hypothetical protein [Moumouvirus maliensis]|nr:hypothetical protein [Moumouvirus maliensis]